MNLNILFQLTNENHLNISKDFIEYSNNTDDICKNIYEYNLSTNRKILINFEDMIADSLSNKKPNATVAELYISGRKLNIPLVFITQFHFVLPRNVRLNSTYHFIMKILNKQKLQQITFNDSSFNNFEFRDFMNLYKELTGKPYSLLVIDAFTFQKEYFRKKVKANHGN